MATYHQGDNTGAFGNTFIKIFLKNPDEVVISKVVFTVGCINKEFENPEFPLFVNFNSRETASMPYENTGYLVAYDSEGRPLTCKGSVTFYIVNGVIKKNGRC